MVGKNIRHFVVDACDTIETALAVIEANSHRSVIVLSEDDRVVGTLSDADVRKAMLNHRLLSTPVREVMNLNIIWLTPDDVGKASELFQRYHIFLIPVVGNRNQLLDVLTAY